MKIIKLIYKNHKDGKILCQIIPETDLANAVALIMPEVSTYNKSTIQMEPVGEMDDKYINSKYLTKDEKPIKVKVNSGSMSGPPF